MQDHQQLKNYILEKPLDVAINRIAMELKQYITWIAACHGAAVVLCPESAEALDNILVLLDKMDTSVVNELLLGTLLPRLQQPTLQDPSPD